MQFAPFSQRLFHKISILAAWLTLPTPTFYRCISEVFTVHEYKDVFLFDFFVARGGKIGSGDTGGGGGPTCPLCSIIGVDIVECMTCLRLIRQTIFAIVTPIALAEISARRWKFSYRESLRACYDTLLIRHDGASSSAAFPVRNGRRYFIYEKSRVLSFSHNSFRSVYFHLCISSTLFSQYSF